MPSIVMITGDIYVKETNKSLALMDIIFQRESLATST